MANRRVLVKRRKAVRNIRKITRTMQLIATARFQAAYNRSVAGKPFTDKLDQMVRDLARAAQGLDHPLMQAPDESLPVDLMVITSNRGLCGAYNANVLRTAGEYLEVVKEQGQAFNVRVVGRKGVAYLNFVGYPLAEEVTHLSDMPRYEDVEPFANAMMDRYVKGEISSVHVAYMRFISTGKQIPVVEQLLPLSQEVGAEEADEMPETELQYEFSPEPRELLDELLPATVRASLYQCFTDAGVSEQVARMVAMKAATDAAEDAIKRLTQQYNRARQTAITMELLDIVGGANALA
jgi:F-type H+-transporting ATPase subunit gamma